MKGTLCCVLRSWGVRPCYGKSFEVGRTMVSSYIQHAKQSTDFWVYIWILWRQNDHFGLQKHKLNQIAARNIRISLEKQSIRKATRKLHEGKYDIRDKILPRTVLVKLLYSRAWRSSPAVIVQKYPELFALMIKAWNFARLLPSPRPTFFDMEPVKIRYWCWVLRMP